MFLGKGIFFVDCPISGGPARARQGDLTMMASGDEESLQKAKQIFNVLGRDGDVHIIAGGAGAGSTVKCVHQLLAGVHICVAAEAMAMAAKASLDVEQLYQIVNGAAGASWMFTDRGKRMLEMEPEVKSALNIFVKDLGIVFEESKKLQTPIPIASAALQQFISGQSLGLGRLDDSQVVKVYEHITKVPVCGSGSSHGDEKVVLTNDFVRICRIKANSESSDAVIVDSNDRLTIRLKDRTSICIRILKSPPALNGTFDFDENVLEDGESTDRFQVYKQSLNPGEASKSYYPFFYLSVSASNGTVEQSVGDGPSWILPVKAGEIDFKEPSGLMRIVNNGTETFERYIVRLF